MLEASERRYANNPNHDAAPSSGSAVPGETPIKQANHLKSAAAIITALLLTAPVAEAEVHVLASDGLRIEIEVAPDRLAAEFGPRFDRTAVVGSVTLDGIELVGPWGLSDEFGLYGDGVLGYDAAQPGETFVKIGVGQLVRDTTENYHFAHPYPVDSLFPVEVTADVASLSVSQRSTGDPGRRYHYRKSYQLLGADKLVIHYELSNTGKKAWTFEHYNHHWFRLKDVAIGPAYRVVTGFELPAADTGLRSTPSSLEMPSPLAPGAAAYYASELAGVKAGANTFELQVDGRPMVSYQASFEPARFAVYANVDGFCPEVFMRASVEPGATVTWSTTYRFANPRPDGRP